MNYARTLKISLMSLSLFLLSCSGGGGGGDSSGEPGVRRSTHTAIRIVHGAVNTVPVDLWIGDQLVQSAKFAEVKYYSEVAPGPTTLRVERANSPGLVLGQVDATLAEDTEYTLYIAGTRSTGNLSLALREDSTLRPDGGFGQIQLINAVQGGDDLTLEVGSASGSVFSDISAGGSSTFATVASGPVLLKVHNDSRSYEENLSYELGDRAEVTLVITGSQSLGVRFARFFPDLD